MGPTWRRALTKSLVCFLHIPMHALFCWLCCAAALGCVNPVLSLCCAVPCRAVPSCAMLCHAVPCCAAPCCAVLSSAVLCHAVLCCYVSQHCARFVSVIAPSCLTVSSVSCWLSLSEVSRQPAHWQKRVVSSSNCHHHVPQLCCSNAKLVTSDSAAVRGYAYSGGGRNIIRVDVSADNGQTWHVATIDNPDQLPFR